MKKIKLLPIVIAADEDSDQTIVIEGDTHSLMWLVVELLKMLETKVHKWSVRKSSKNLASGDDVYGIYVHNTDLCPCGYTDAYNKRKSNAELQESAKDSPQDAEE